MHLLLLQVKRGLDSIFCLTFLGSQGLQSGAWSSWSTWVMELLVNLGYGVVGSGTVILAVVLQCRL